MKTKSEVIRKYTHYILDYKDITYTVIMVDDLDSLIKDLSEIEPDNEKAKTELQKLNDFLNKEYNFKETIEKPYLFYEGEKYYFGEEYEFSEDGEEWDNRELHGADLRNPVIFNSYSKSFNHIRKIDHTSKYKKKFLELKMEAEKDGVNLKELL